MTIEEIEKDESSRNAVPLFEEAFGLYHSGRLQEADTKFEATISAFPKFSDAHYYRGLIAVKGNDVDGAIMHFEKALDCFGGNLEVHLAIADSYMKKHENKKAKMHFNAAISIFSFENRAYTGLGRIALNEGNLELAKRMAHTAIEKNPFDAMAHKLLGDVHLKQGKELAAHNNYKLAKIINPQLGVDEKAAYGADGKLNIGLESGIEAMLESAFTFNWEMALANCDFSVASFNYARLCEDVDEAIKVLEESLKKNPYDCNERELMAEVCAFKAQELKKSGKLKEAIPYLEKSIANDFKNKNIAPCALELSNIFSEEGETDKAAYYLRCCVQALHRKLPQEGASHYLELGQRVVISNSLMKYNWASWDMSRSEEEGLEKLASALNDAQDERCEKVVKTLEDAIKNCYFVPLWLGEAYYELGMAYYELGQLDKSIEASELGLNASSSVHAPHLLIAISSIDQEKEVDDLRSHMIMALLKNPQNIAAYSLFAEYYSDASEKIRAECLKSENKEGTALRIQRAEHYEAYSKKLSEYAGKIEDSLKQFSE